MSKDITDAKSSLGAKSKMSKMSKNRDIITVRAVIIGLACASFLCLITPYNDYYIRGTFAAGNHFPIGSFFLFTLLILVVNVVLRKFYPGSELSPSELITIWCMMLVASGIPSSGLMRYHLFMLTAPFYFDSPENDWKDLFHQYLPNWLVIKDLKAAKYFYEGLPPGAPVPWGLWLKPALLWSLYFLATYFVLICLSTILRKQWVERERFSFPLVKLPAEMVERPIGEKSRLNSFLKNRLTWIGFAIPVFLHTINGLHRYFPYVPEIPLYFYPDKYFTERPWTALRSTIMMIYPSVIGFSYLLSLDVSFSFWFFYMIYKLQSLIAFAAGFPASGWTLANRQEMGGYLALVAFVLWIARHHLKDVFLKTLGLKSKRIIDDSNEPLPYRMALIGLVAGTILTAAFGSAAGMSFWLALGIMLFFYIMAIVLTWMVVDGGFLFLLAIFRPSDYLVISLGTSRFSASDLTIMAYEKTMMFDLREFMMPHLMNSFKAADAVNLSRRKLLAILCLTLVLAVGVSYCSGLWLWYHKGGLNLSYWYAPEPFNRLATQLTYPTSSNWLDLSFIFTGVGVMSFLIFMRYRFFWWRVHPLGYAMTTSWAPFTVWFSFFLGWAFKYSILKYGGFSLYNKARPLFLGMVVGESLIGGIWIIIGMITKVSYRIMPG